MKIAVMFIFPFKPSIHHQFTMASRLLAIDLNFANPVATYSLQALITVVP